LTLPEATGRALKARTANPILFLMSDGSIDLLANDSETPYLAENAFHLDSDETYRLFISLHEQYKQQNARMEEERMRRRDGKRSRSSH